MAAGKRWDFARSGVDGESRGAFNPSFSHLPHSAGLRLDEPYPGFALSRDLLNSEEVSMSRHKSFSKVDLPQGGMGERTPSGDRGTGISKQRAALAAAMNVLADRSSADQIGKLAVNFISASSPQRAHDRPEEVRELRRIAKAILKECTHDFEDGHYRPKRTVPDHIDHLPHIRFLISPQGHLLLADDVEACIGIWPEVHSAELDNLRSRSRLEADGVYDRVIRGDFAAVLGLYRQGRLKAYKAGDLARVIRSHARCYTVRTAHSKIDILHAHSKAPFGNRFSGVNKWPLVGSTVLETSVAPACLIQRLTAAIKNGEFDGMSDDQLLAQAIHKNFLPAGADGADILAMARAVLGRLEACGAIGSYDIAAAVDAITLASEPVSQLNRGHMRQAGFARMDFAEHRLGLSASEGSAFVAREMIRAFRHIDASVSAILAGTPVTVLEMSAVAIKPLAFAAVLLRTEGNPDRNANARGSVVNVAGKDLDKTRGSGRLPVKSMLDKIKDPEVEVRARRTLGIDPTIWFR